VASQEAPTGLDSRGNPVSFGAENAIDGRYDTCWRAPGDGQGQWLRLELGGTFHIERIGVIPGYDKVDPYDGTDRFPQEYRVRRARFTFSDGSSIEYAFQDDRRMQFVPVRYISTSYVVIQILETFPPETVTNRLGTPLPQREFIPISEVELWGYAGP
jgi:hypothetical protein